MKGDDEDDGAANINGLSQKNCQDPYCEQRKILPHNHQIVI
jgi:hypothetical protein